MNLSSFALMLLALILVGCVASYKIPLRQNEVFSEETAIRVSREALTKAGVDVAGLEPAPYRGGHQSGERLLARNTVHPDQSYVLWHRRSENTLFQYSVAMTVIDGYVTCEVGRTK